MKIEKEYRGPLAALLILMVMWLVMGPAFALGPTIKEVSAQSTGNESLLDYLLKMPTTADAQIFYALLIGNAVGIVGHFIKGRASGDISGSILDYLFRQNPARSAYALLGVLMWSAGEVGTGLFVTDSGVFIGWGLVLLSGIKTGYAGDELVNKGSRPVWTEQQRAAVVDATTTVSPGGSGGPGTEEKK